MPIAAVTVKVRSPALVRVLGHQIRNKSVLERVFGLTQLKTVFLNIQGGPKKNGTAYFR